MTTSGSVNFAITRDDIIKAALRKIGVLEGGEVPSADDTTDAALALNMMLKARSTRGFPLWAQQQATLFLQQGVHRYLLGPSGDHGTHSYTSTTVKVAAIAGATTIDVVSTTGMAAADYIGFELDSGASHWAAVQSVTDSDTVVITGSGLASAAAIGNNVWFYRTKMHRPLRIPFAFTSNLETNADYPIEILYDRDDYFGLYDKVMDSAPTKIYYEPLLTNGALYTNYEQTNVNEVLKLVYQRPLEDFDVATDNPDVPQEEYENLVYNLAVRLAPDHGLPVAQRTALITEARILGINVDGFYQENPTKVIPTWF